jgi:hypothetical protein
MISNKKPRSPPPITRRLINGIHQNNTNPTNPANNKKPPIATIMMFMSYPQESICFVSNKLHGTFFLAREHRGSTGNLEDDISPVNLSAARVVLPHNERPRLYNLLLTGTITFS